MTSCEHCRKTGEKLMLKGERCFSVGCMMIKHPYGPGAHGQGEMRSKKSEYGRQLEEKQKAKAIYGLRERQFRNYVTKAERMAGNSALNMIRLLELRLDNVVYRLKFAVSRAQARQLVSHGLIRVNGSKVNIPSYILKEGDVVEPKSKKGLDDLKPDAAPNWLELNPKKVVGKVKQLPLREQIDSAVNDSLIIEYYSR